MDIKKPDIDFKAVLGKLAFLKNHLNMLVPLLIAIVGGVLFIPAHIINAGLRKDIQAESVERAQKLKRLAESVVPETAYEIEKKYQEAYAKDANAVKQWMEGTSQRQLLRYNLFPPQTTSSFVFEEFASEYLNRLGQQLDELAAIGCPTQDQLAEHIEGFSGGRGRGARGVDPYGGRGGRSSDTAATQQKVVDAICRGRAESGQVYLQMSALAGTSFWGRYDYSNYASFDDALEACWYWQLGYWIIDDVLDVVRVCNQGSPNVLRSPVKRLMTVQFNRPTIAGMQSSIGRGRGRGSSSSGEGGDLLVGLDDSTESSNVSPKYVRSSAQYLTTVWPGRTCDEQWDVAHFAVQAVVAAQDVMTFQREMCSMREHVFLGTDGQGPEQRLQHNQIGILEIHINAVDRQSAKHLYYRYGNDAVVEVTLICEYLFNKAGYDPWVPESVHKLFEDSSEDD